MRLASEIRVVVEHARGIRILRKDGGEAFRAVVLPGEHIHDLDADAEGLHAGLHDLNGMRMAFVGDDDPRGRGDMRHGQAERLGTGGAFIEQGGIRDIQPGEIADHGLEVQQGLEAALGDLRLIGRVGGVPAGVLKDVPLDDGRREGVVIAEADETAHDLVAAHDLPEAGEGLLLAERRRQIQRLAASNALRDHFPNQFIERCASERLQHRLRFRRRGTDVAAGEVCGHF